MVFCISEQFKLLLTEYSKMDDKTGNKYFPYRQQLTHIAHREQVALIIDLDDVRDFDEELAEIVTQNSRRYVNLLLNVSVESTLTVILLIYSVDIECVYLLIACSRHSS